MITVVKSHEFIIGELLGVSTLDGKRIYKIDELELTRINERRVDYSFIPFVEGYAAFPMLSTIEKCDPGDFIKVLINELSTMDIIL
jgi:hypothetical protein